MIKWCQAKTKDTRKIKLEAEIGDVGSSTVGLGLAEGECSAHSAAATEFVAALRVWPETFEGFSGKINMKY